MSLLCLIKHDWEPLGSTRWVYEPRLSVNAPGVAMEYRRCCRCDAVTDVSLFDSFADHDYGVPNALGPLASARVLEIVAVSRAAQADPKETHAD